MHLENKDNQENPLEKIEISQEFNIVAFTKLFGADMNKS